MRSDSVVCASRGAAARGPRMQIHLDRVRRLLVLSHAYLGVDRTASRCSTGTDCECRRAYAAGLERRAARGSEASSQNGCRPSQPRHAHHSMCNARVLGKTEAHSLRHISPRTQLAPSHAMPYHTSLREHRRPLGGKSGCRLPIAEPIADRRLYDCRVSCSCVIMCSCLPSSRMTRACRDECERMWGRAGTAGGMRPAARGVRATTRGESRAPSARMPCVRTSPRADPVQNRIAA